MHDILKQKTFCKPVYMVIYQTQRMNMKSVIDLSANE